MVKGRNKVLGVTLVELLVAVTIAAIVGTMAINIYLSAKKNYTKVKSKAEQDIKELTVKKIFLDVISNAGFSCKYGSSKQKYLNRTGENELDFRFMYDSSPLRMGNIASIGGFLKTSLGKSKGSFYQPHTDYIMIKSENSFTSLASSPVNLDLFLNSAQKWSKGDYLALCNNETIDIVRVVNSSEDNKQVELATAPYNEYYKGDYVGKYSIQILYVAANQTMNNPGKLNYSLYMYTKSGSNPGASYPIIDGVSDLKLSYSIFNRDQLHWQNIVKNTDLDDIKARAIKVSFKLNGEHFDKVILL